MLSNTQQPRVVVTTTTTTIDTTIQITSDGPTPPPPDESLRPPLLYLPRPCIEFGCVVLYVCLYGLWMLFFTAQMVLCLAYLVKALLETTIGVIGLGLVIGALVGLCIQYPDTMIVHLLMAYITISFALFVFFCTMCLILLAYATIRSLLVVVISGMTQCGFDTACYTRIHNFTRHYIPMRQ